MAVQVLGIDFAGVEQLERLVTEGATGTSNATIVATGTPVAVCGYSYVNTTIDGLFIIDHGDGLNAWVVQNGAAGLEQNLEFDHPLILDGLAIAISVGARRWSVTYKRLA